MVSSIQNLENLVDRLDLEDQHRQHHLHLEYRRRLGNRLHPLHRLDLVRLVHHICLVYLGDRLDLLDLRQ